MTTSTAPSLPESLRLSLLRSARRLLELETRLRPDRPPPSELERLRRHVLLIELVTELLVPASVIPPSLAALDPDRMLQEKAILLGARLKDLSPSARSARARTGSGP